MLNPSWFLVEILKLVLVKILKLKFYGEADVWLRFWSRCLFEILKMKFDHNLCLNLWYELNPLVRCAFGNVLLLGLLVSQKIKFTTLEFIYKALPKTLSSPRAESARAVTGRQCRHSGEGEDFLTRRPVFSTKTAIITYMCFFVYHFFQPTLKSHPIPNTCH